MRLLRLLNAMLLILILLGISHVQAASVPQDVLLPASAESPPQRPTLPAVTGAAAAAPTAIGSLSGSSVVFDPSVGGDTFYLPGEPQVSASLQTVLDDFNRADGPIGSNWTVHDGYCNVSSNAAVCGGMGRATFNGYVGNGNVAEADIENVGTALQYTGLLLNYGAGSSNLFLKVQNQSGGNQFGHAGCYTGNNGAPFGLGFFALSSPFTTAHMRATRVGNDVTIEFTNIDGGAQSDQTYVCSGAPAPEGTGIGILGYAGIARLDNFGVPPMRIAIPFVTRNF